MSLKDKYVNSKLPGSLSGISGFVKNQYENKDESTKELQKLDAYALHKPVIKKFKRQRVLVEFLEQQFVADLKVVTTWSRQNKGYKYLLICLNAFSKYMYIVPLKSKTGKTLVDAFTAIFNECGYYPRLLQTDMGTEFKNKLFISYLKKHHVKLFHTFSQLKATLAERAIRTIMEKIARYMTYTKSKRYIDVLPDIVESYNKTYHHSIKMAPVDVNESNQTIVYDNLYKKYFEDMINTPIELPKFKVGDIVKISKEKLKFTKGYQQNWTTENFKINTVRTFTRPVTYTLEDINEEVITGAFYEKELSLVEAVQDATPN